MLTKMPGILTQHPSWGPGGAMHLVERMERKKREEEVRCPWREPGWGYTLYSSVGEVVKQHRQGLYHKDSLNTLDDVLLIL